MQQDKISLQNSVAFLYNNDEHIEKEIRETTLFTLVLVGKNYIEVNLSW